MTNVEVKVDRGLALLSKEEMQEILRRVGQRTYDIWSDLAREGLHRTRDAYLKALKPPRIEGDEVIVEFDGRGIAEYIEEGQRAFDMTKRLKGRRYIVIPFDDDSGSPQFMMRPRGSRGRSSAQAAAQDLYARVSVQRSGTRFRTLSEKSSGWQHPGLDARDFFTKAAARVEDEIPKIIDEVLAERQR